MTFGYVCLHKYTFFPARPTEQSVHGLTAVSLLIIVSMKLYMPILIEKFLFYKILFHFVLAIKQFLLNNAVLQTESLGN